MPLILRRSLHVSKTKVTRSHKPSKMTTNINVDIQELFKSLENKLLNAITSKLQGNRCLEGAHNAEDKDAEWADATSSTIAEEINEIDLKNLLSQHTPLQKAIDIIHKVLTDDADFLYLKDFIESLLSKRDQRLKGISFILIVLTDTYYCYLLRFIIYGRR